MTATDDDICLSCELLSQVSAVYASVLWPSSSFVHITTQHWQNDIAPESLKSRRFRQKPIGHASVQIHAAPHVLNVMWYGVQRPVVIVNAPPISNPCAAKSPPSVTARHREGRLRGPSQANTFEEGFKVCSILLRDKGLHPWKTIKSLRKCWWRKMIKTRYILTANVIHYYKYFAWCKCNHYVKLQTMNYLHHQ